ncbi:cytosine deaminase, partial [Salmonella enterica subsp. enterica serovar Enteritidis str. 6.0562-1]
GLNLITTHSAKTLHLQDYGLSVGNAANLVGSDDEQNKFFEALVRGVW